MKEEETLNLFAEVCISISRLLNLATDKFFAQKLNSKFSNLIILFFRSPGKSSDDNVAQYVIPRQVIAALSDIEEIIDELQYLKLARQTHLLSARKNILRLKLNFLRSKNKTADKKKIRLITLPAKRIKLSPGKEKILTFIKNFPRARSKEVIDQFKEISTRTVKRYLQELTQAGYLDKISENSAIFYSARH